MTRSLPKLALPWILEEDWPQWQAVDHGVPTYQKWVELFDKNLALAETYGWPYERVPVRPDLFNAWCEANRRSAGKFDRSLYALEILRETWVMPSAEAANREAMEHVSATASSESGTPHSVETKANSADGVSGSGGLFLFGPLNETELSAPVQ